MDYLMEVKVLKLMHIGTQFNGWKDLQKEGHCTVIVDGWMDGWVDGQQKCISCELQKT